MHSGLYPGFFLEGGGTKGSSFVGEGYKKLQKSITNLFIFIFVTFLQVGQTFQERGFKPPNLPRGGFGYNGTFFPVYLLLKGEIFQKEGLTFFFSENFHSARRANYNWYSWHLSSS